MRTIKNQPYATRRQLNDEWRQMALERLWEKLLTLVIFNLSQFINAFSIINHEKNILFPPNYFMQPGNNHQEKYQG